MRSISTARWRGLFLPALLALTAAWIDPSAVRAEQKQARHVSWREPADWQEVLTAAAGAGRPVLLDFTASWCGPCRLMEAMVFNEPAVIDALADVLTCRVDLDRPAAAAIQSRFEVTVLPTLIWCEPSGREVDRFTGYRNSDAFLAEVDRWRRGEGTFLDLQRRYALLPESPAVLLGLADQHRRRGHDRRAEILYRRLTNLGTAAEDSVRVRATLGLAEVGARLGDGRRARDLARVAAAAAAGLETDAPAALREVVACQAAIGDTAGMMETWRRLVHLDDRDVGALDGFARAALQQRTELDGALRSALRAVVLSDKDPCFMGTLAECYYRQGNFRRAIRWIRESIDKDPKEALYQDRLVRYEEALENDPYGFYGTRR